MNKRKYRSIHVNDVEVETLKETFSGTDLVISVDVAKKTQYAALADTEGAIEEVIRWKHPKETREFINVMDRLNSSGVQMVLEPTGTYGDALRYLGYEQGWTVYQLSPKRVHDAAEVFDGVPSLHDPKAAHLLIRLHTHGVSKRWEETSRVRRRLKVLTKRMSNLEEAWQRHHGRMEARLARHWPGILQDWDLDRATLLGLLESFGGPRQIRANEQDAREYMRDMGGYLLGEKTIELVLKSARETVGVPLLESERRILCEQAREMNRIRCQKRTARRALIKEVERLEPDGELERLGRVIGIPTAAVCRVEMGSFQQFGSPQALIKAAGLNLKEKSSGTHQGRLKITKRGSGTVRRFLYLATCRMIKNDPNFRAWHEKKVARENGKRKNKSVIALTRKLLKGLWHVARGKTFDSTKLFDVDQLQAA